MKIAICFYGIIRNIECTINSIRNNVILPAEKFGDVKIVTHLFDQKHVSNLRSGENSFVDTGKSVELGSHVINIEKPDDFLKHTSFDIAKAYGDHWGDNYASLRNLYHQLYSIKKVYGLTLDDEYDLVIFVRPDLIYHDNFSVNISKVLIDKRRDLVSLADWQHWGMGFNDRFAICKGEGVTAWGSRIDMIEEFLLDTRKPVHAERLLKFALQRNKKVSIVFNKIRASRVRANGEVKRESFMSYKIYNPAYKALKVLGLRG